MKKYVRDLIKAGNRLTVASEKLWWKMTIMHGNDKSTVLLNSVTQDAYNEAYAEWTQAKDGYNDALYTFNSKRKKNGKKKIKA